MYLANIIVVRRVKVLEFYLVVKESNFEQLHHFSEHVQGRFRFLELRGVRCWICVGVGKSLL